MGIVAKILSYLSKQTVAMPIQVERELGIPRYAVFGSIIVLEELGLIKPVARRANWKLYTLTEKGRKLVEEGKTTIELETRIQEPS